MNRYRIAVIVGSLRRDSYNRRLAKAVIRLGPPDFDFQPVDIAGLPLYNQDDDEHPAPSVTEFKREIDGAQGLLFVTPEYNRSIPGVLKNALDHGSRPAGKNSWAGKPAGILGISPGAVGTAAAQQHLRNVLACLDVAALGQPEAYIQYRDGFFGEPGEIGEGGRKLLRKWMDRYAAWVRRLAPPLGS